MAAGSITEQIDKGDIGELTDADIRHAGGGGQFGTRMVAITIRYGCLRAAAGRRQ
jgi:hypothetical protein